jgi:SAM-dependent methyltransferase
LRRIWAEAVPALAKAAAILEERIALMAPSRRLRLGLAGDTARRYADGRAIRVLDAGCGDGLLALALAKSHPRWAITGMDIDPGLLASARARAQARALNNVEFIAADLTRTLPAGGFDVVLALECLTEIPDDRAALLSMAASLAPGGLFVAQVPSESWKPILPGSAGTWRKEVRHGYSPAQLDRALAATGFEAIEIQPTFHSATMAAQEVRDKIKNAGLVTRALAFPLMAAAARLERAGLRLGHPNALLASARRPGMRPVPR